MLVQNELGTLQPVAEIARRLEALGPRRPHFHVDAVQAFGLVRLRPRALGADTIALSAHKLHGPRGAGALWVRPGARCGPSGWAAARSAACGAGPRTSPPWSASVGRDSGPPALADGAGEAVAARDGWKAALAAVARSSRRAAHGDGGAARPAHRLPGLPGAPGRAAAARPRGARGVRLGRLRLRLEDGGSQPHAESHWRRQSHGRAALLALPRHDGRGRRRRRRALAEAAAEIAAPRRTAARAGRRRRDMERVLLCRFGELFLKCGNRLASNERWPETSGPPSPTCRARACSPPTAGCWCGCQPPMPTTPPRGSSGCSGWSRFPSPAGCPPPPTWKPSAKPPSRRRRPRRAHAPR